MKSFFTKIQKQTNMTKSLYDDDPFLECYAIVKGKMANRISLNDVELVMAENIRRFYAAVHSVEEQTTKR